MPKTKEQKRKEALERAIVRDVIPARALMLESQPGGVEYNKILYREGRHNADHNATSSLKDFKKLCDRLKIDTSGNPL